MLSIDAARAAGYADSSSFFRRAQYLVKIQMTDKEREAAVDLGKVASSMRFRSVTMIAARNVYKFLGARAVKGESASPYFELVASFSSSYKRLRL